MIRKLLYLLGGVAAGIALARLLRGRPPAATEVSGASSSLGAEALRAQLAASRTGTEPAAQESPSSDAAESPTVADVDEARRRVHGRGRETVDEMRRSAESG